MLVLKDEQLKQLLPLLEADLPRSLPVFHLLRNNLRGRFAWPGLEFVVDDFPNVSVCICRPEHEGGKYVPIVNGYSVFIYSRNPEALKKMLFEQRAVDWSKPIIFLHAPEPEHLLLLEEGKNFPEGRFDQVHFRRDFPEGAFAYLFDLPNLDLTYTLPDGYHMGPLQPHHAAMIGRDRKYGHEENNTIYFRRLISSGFPTAAVYSDTEPDVPVAYIVLKAEGAIGAAFVKKELRSMGLARAVAFELFRQLRELGETWVWGDVMKFNIASQRTVEAGGGKKIEGMDIHWIGYLPNSVEGEIRVEYYV
ncbi:uncharacterized protein LOC129591119 [Paramacrobiotus metropolitanus]|uniref:uncharacterized protein LOC129591119 n=1 Tax=Paramacrobiotus metropolitanus TaxID=2943436 RepID=UPI002446337B|nr:uncharacterized protein LOC129591119 [Paramacrobiotus metropolitanus]